MLCAYLLRTSSREVSCGCRAEAGSDGLPVQEGMAAAVQHLAVPTSQRCPLHVTSYPHPTSLRPIHNDGFCVVPQLSSMFDSHHVVVVPVWLAVSACDLSNDRGPADFTTAR